MAIVVETAGSDTLETSNLESSRSAVSWAAIVGGAVAAASASLVLVLLGSALGFASISPWPSASASAAAVGVGAVIWLVVTQWLSAAFGGYLTGRLRTKWAAMNSDEVFFRDTAHGFLSWALSTAIVVWILMSAAGGGANIAATLTSGVAQGATQAAGQTSDPLAYLNDQLFRAAPGAGPAADASTATPAASPAGTTNGSNGANAEMNAESTRILSRGITTDLAPADRTYLAQMVSQRTGLSQADAEKRVDDVIAQAKQAAETARKAATAIAFATALSLLVGAFVASVGGAIGGRHRDEI